jgi:hypothetical protein
MKERLVRIAKWNQRVLGAVLLAVAYTLGIGPASVALRFARLVGLAKPPRRGWQPLARREYTLDDLKEQS